MDSQEYCFLAWLNRRLIHKYGKNRVRKQHIRKICNIHSIGAWFIKRRKMVGSCNENGERRLVKSLGEVVVVLIDSLHYARTCSTYLSF